MGEVPAYINETGYTYYHDIVASWGYQIVDSASFGDYQGDAVYLLQDGDRYGYVIIGYGSCSGCDALEAVLPHCSDVPLADLDWGPVIRLAESMHSSIDWHDSKQVLYVTLLCRMEQMSGNEWWLYEKEMLEWLIEKTAPQASEKEN